MDDAEPLSRSEIRTYEQAIRHGWQLPESVYKAVPTIMFRVLVDQQSTKRDKIAAARVLAMLKQDNDAATEKTVDLRSPSPSITINNGVQVATADGGRVTALSIVQRLRAGDVSVDAPAGAAGTDSE